MTVRVMCFAPCPQGVESLLADELRGLGVAGVRPQRAGCSSRARWRRVPGAAVVAARIRVLLLLVP